MCKSSFLEVWKLQNFQITTIVILGNLKSNENFFLDFNDLLLTYQIWWGKTQGNKYIIIHDRMAKSCWCKIIKLQDTLPTLGLARNIKLHKTCRTAKALQQKQLRQSTQTFVLPRLLVTYLLFLSCLCPFFTGRNERGQNTSLGKLLTFHVCPCSLCLQTMSEWFPAHRNHSFLHF